MKADDLRRRDAPIGSLSHRCAHEHVELAAAFEEHRAEDARAPNSRHLQAEQTKVLDDLTERNIVAGGVVL